MIGPKPSEFNPDEFRGNELRIGNFQKPMVLVRIPNLPDRICRKQSGESIYIELTTTRIYNREKHQPQNFQVKIGDDISGLYRGMMVPTDQYYWYFDHDGHPKYDEHFPKVLPSDEDVIPPEERTRETEEETPDTAADRTATKTTETKTDKEIPSETTTTQPETTTNQTEKTKTLPQPTPRSAAGATHAADGTLITPIPLAEESVLTQEQMEEIERKDREARRIADEKQRESDRIDYLRLLLMSYSYRISMVAEKKPDTPLTVCQIRRINHLLRDLQAIFRDCENSEYLRLAEEPGEDENGEENPRITYGDMDLIMAAYDRFFWAMVMDELWYRKNKES